MDGQDSGTCLLHSADLILDVKFFIFFLINVFNLVLSFAHSIQFILNGEHRKDCTAFAFYTCIIVEIGEDIV